MPVLQGLLSPKPGRRLLSRGIWQMLRVAPIIAALAALAACSGSPQPQVNRGYSLPPQPSAAAPRVATAPAPPVEPGEAVWHLRAGLNVAALSCRGKGRAAVAVHYSRVLAWPEALLATA